MANSLETIQSILEQRQLAYGSFEKNAWVATQLKTIVKLNSEYFNLSNEEKEAIDQICSKLSRIVSGNSTAVHRLDSWQDIIGYAALISDKIENTLLEKNNEALQEMKDQVESTDDDRSIMDKVSDALTIKP